MATSIEAQGHTVDEAIQIALNQLGVSRDKVEIEILHHPRRGLLGIGARRAKVRATLRESVMADGEEFDMSGGADLDDKPRRRRRRGGRSRGGRGDDRPEVAAQAPPGGGREPGPSRVEGERRRDGGERRGDGQAREARGDGRRGGEGDAQRGRGGEGARSRDDRRGGRGRGDQRGERPGGEGQPREARGGGQEGRDRGGRPQEQGDRQGGRGDQRGRQPQQPRDQRDGGDRRDRNRPQQQAPVRAESGEQEQGERAAEAVERGPHIEPTGDTRGGQLITAQRGPAADEAPIDAAALDAIRARAEELVRELLSKMGFAAEVTSSVDEECGEALVSVRAENEGLLIGRRGQTLDSLEHIVNRMAMRGDSYVEGRVQLDIGDYRRRRRESLEELAGRLKNRAVGERRTVQVSPMSPRDRRYFALAFADDETVEVRALGAGFYRRVIVAPAGMGAAAAAAAEAGGGTDEETVDGGFSGAEAEV
jgi:predicted RNA-binding protein Jag